MLALAKVIRRHNKMRNPINHSHTNETIRNVFWTAHTYNTLNKLVLRNRKQKKKLMDFARCTRGGSHTLAISKGFSEVVPEATVSPHTPCAHAVRHIVTATRHAHEAPHRRKHTHTWTMSTRSIGIAQSVAKRPNIEKKGQHTHTGSWQTTPRSNHTKRLTHFVYNLPADRTHFVALAYTFRLPYANWYRIYFREVGLRAKVPSFLARKYAHTGHTIHALLIIIHVTIIPKKKANTT